MCACACACVHPAGSFLSNSTAALCIISSYHYVRHPMLFHFAFPIFTMFLSFPNTPPISQQFYEKLIQTLCNCGMCSRQVTDKNQEEIKDASVSSNSLRDKYTQKTWRMFRGTRAFKSGATAGKERRDSSCDRYHPPLSMAQNESRRADGHLWLSWYLLAS